MIAKEDSSDRRSSTEELLFEGSDYPNDSEILKNPSFEQISLWNNTKNLNDGSRNMFLITELRGALDLSFLQLSFDEIMRRHEPLRSSFCVKDGQLLVKVNQSQQAPVQIVNFECTNAENAKRRVIEQCIQESKQDLDLQSTSLFIVKIYVLSKDHFLLFFLVDHLVFDGWSLGVFKKELSHIYNSLCTSGALDLWPIKASFYELSQEKIEHFLSAESDEFFQFWEQFLVGPIQEHFLSNQLRVQTNEREVASKQIVLKTVSMLQVKEIAKKYEVTIFILLLATLSLVLYNRTYTADILVKVAAAGRSKAGSRRLMGLFRKMLLYRVTVDTSQTVSQYLRDIKSMCSKVINHEDGPVGTPLYEELVQRKVWRKTPFFPVAMQYENFPLPNLLLPGIISRDIFIESGGGDEELDIIFTPSEVNLTARVKYNVAIFDEISFVDLFNNFETTLLSLSQDVLLSELVNSKSQKV